jgi:hypothetical protein
MKSALLPAVPVGASACDKCCSGSAAATARVGPTSTIPPRVGRGDDTGRSTDQSWMLAPAVTEESGGRQGEAGAAGPSVCGASPSPGPTRVRDAASRSSELTANSNARCLRCAVGSVARWEDGAPAKHEGATPGGDGWRRPPPPPALPGADEDPLPLPLPRLRVGGRGGAGGEPR